MNASVVGMLAGLITAAGVYLLFGSLVFPANLRLQEPGSRPGERLQAYLEAAELSLSAREFVGIAAALMVLAGLIGALLRSPVLGAVGGLVLPLLYWQGLMGKRDDFKRAYAGALAEVVGLLREGFSASGNMSDALQNVVDNGPDPAAADFREVWQATRVGTPLADAFAPVLARRREPYLNMIAEALTLKQTQGGNVGEVLLGLETMIRDQAALRQEINAKQAQVRLESTIISLAPMGFFLVMKLLPWMRQYENGFYNTALGQGVLLIAVVFSVLAYGFSRRLAGRGLNLEIQEVTALELPMALRGKA